MTDSLSACRINIKFESTITKKTPYGDLKVVESGGRISNFFPPTDCIK